ncbi:uncharacterized protein LOC141639022 [Silene latifolia]|uniref:uncharacterized protein LOC141639022 n=1 Tax=Silene latifolia TaxID=37657 RepID=UPI003D772C7B
MIGCWAIWEHRNKVVFDDQEVNPLVVIRRAKDVMEETEGGGALLGRKGCGRVREENEKGGKAWNVPPEGFVKINVDAGVKEGDGTGLGVVCRDERGRVQWGMSEVRDQVLDPHVAEALAVYEGLQEARRRGIQHIVVESDCLMVVEALRKRTKGRSDFSLIVDDVLALCSFFTSVCWSFTSRLNNSVAHILAHCQPRVVGRVCWSDVLPEKANDAVLFDLSLI